MMQMKPSWVDISAWKLKCEEEQILEEVADL